MRVAVIGGGAAGMAAAWYLGARHRVTVFERQAVLGGNIRTLGRNVACPGLPAEHILEAGVIEFSRENFPRFHALMEELGVELREVPATTALYVDGKPPLASPGNRAAAGLAWGARLAAWWRLRPVAAGYRRFFARTRDAAAAELYDRPLDAYLDPGPFAEWARLLMLYAYSIPPEHLGRLPAALAVPALRRFLRPHRWTAIRGGVYTWIERVLERRQEALTVHTSARIRGVRRSAAGIEIDLEGERLRFDKVVIATTPDQVLPLLADAGDDERRRFGAWEGNEARTLVHSDTGLYERRGISYFSEFDLFSTAAGRRGYNAYLNRLCAVPASSGAHYGLSYGIDEEIDPARVVHSQLHLTPLYTVDALRTREEIRAANGERHTLFAGAWLGDGLHEGAIRSAEEAARLVDY